MSRLDQHVATVQSKLVLRQFGQLLARSTFVLGVIVLLAVLADKFLMILPDLRYRWILLGAIGFCVAISLAWALYKRPSREQAAAAIDEKLGLKEKFSTAIYVRPSSDAFAMAAVRDAESAANTVKLDRQFPVPYPRLAFASKALFVAALALAYYMPAINLFGRETPQAKKQELQETQQIAKAAVDRAIAAVDAMPRSAQSSDEFRKLVAELRDLQKASKYDDAARANRRALQALQEVKDQVGKDYDKARKFAEAQNSMMQALQPPDDAKGPIGEARREIAKGNFDAAASKIEEAVKNFDKMDKQQKEEAAKQLQQAAQQLQQMAQNPQQQQQVQQQLQQMGANQQQAQKMQQLMQQAAQGGQAGQQAAQQLQQQVQQMAQQMNNGQGANVQQQQQLQQAIQQMQAQANAQNQANGLAQAAGQMAQAMQQAQQQQQGGNGQQNAQQQAQMQQAQQGMQKALQNMQGVKQDLQQMAQQMQQAQQNMQQGQQAANGQQQGNGQQQANGQQGGQQGGAQQPGGQPGQQAGQGQNGQFAQGQPNQQGNGQGGPGIGAGGAGQKVVNPFGTKMEQSQSQDDPKGRILASYLVKDKADPGQQRMLMQELVQKAEKEAVDEIDGEHASPAAKKAAQEYFRTMQQEKGVPAKTK